MGLVVSCVAAAPSPWRLASSGAMAPRTQWRTAMGRNAIVTGASGGIGRTVAERLARDGFSVVLNYAGTRALHAWEGTTPNELARMGQPPVVATPAQVPRRQIVPCR